MVQIKQGHALITKTANREEPNDQTKYMCFIIIFLFPPQENRPTAEKLTTD